MGDHRDPHGARDDWSLPASGTIVPSSSRSWNTSGRPAGRRQATVGYDPRGLRTGTTYSDTTPAISRTYDKAGRPATVTDATGTRTLGYDPAGRLTSVSKPTGGAGFAYGYDTVGNLTSRQYPDGRKLTYTYNGDRRRTQQTIDGATTSYAYDPAGQLTSTTLPAGNGYTESRSYDPAGRLSAIASTKAGTTLASWQLTRDAAGQPTSVNASRLGLGDGVQTYSYDQAGRLLSGCPVSPATVGCANGALTYTYDKVGNRLTQTDSYGTTTSTYDAADQLTKTSIGSATTTYAYDADGNLTTVKNPYRDQTVASGSSLASGAILTSNNARLIMQADGNLVLYQIDTGLAVWSTATAGHPGARATMQTDGNFVVTDTNGTVLWSTNTAGNTGAVAKVQDDGNLVLYDTANKALWASKTYRDPLAIHATTYTYNPLGLPQSQHDTSGASYHHHDWVGSVTDLTNSTGTQQSRTTYDPYGRSGTATTATGAPTTPFGFTGQYNDPVVPGKQYLRAREYDTANGRFNTRDPLASPASSPYTSAYTYAAGAPTIYTDPTGLSPEDDDPEKMGNLEAIRSGLVKGFKMPFEFVGDVFNAVTGRNGGAGAFVDKYIPIRPAYAMYVAAAKLREFGCNNVADKVEKQADELATQVVLAGLGGVRSWGKKAFGEKVDIAGGGAALRRWWAADVRTTLNGETYLVPSTPGLTERINPGCGTRNCGPVSVATDQLLAGRNPSPVPAADNPLFRPELQALAGSSQPFVQKGGLSGIVSDMQGWGNGSRAIVMGQPSAADMAKGVEAHYFNVINDNGAVVFLDAQTGRAVPEGYRYYFIMRTH
ncbi:RHS repeat-associated core domain-containing protein [Kitasatospora sp. NPDC093102]|uniref:RHS repeat-associated core domain-containing protein n=1 Tax=Kitasatospora sp. NPDC093102 TaxID=3155069 RepID=UPI00344173D8